jgi:hypothetical protein
VSKAFTDQSPLIFVQAPIVVLVNHCQRLGMFLNKGSIRLIIEKWGNKAQALALGGAEVPGLPFEDLG